VTDITDHRPPVRGLDLNASANAPCVYFDMVAASGHINGVIQVTLVANRLVPIGGNVDIDQIISGHLRMSVAAAHSLKLALEAAILLAAPAASDAEN
jgi:hypothetical protein